MNYIFLAAIVLVTSVPAQAASYYGNDGYSRRVRNACESATRVKTRYSSKLDVPAAKRCFVDVLEIHRQQRLIESEIELNEQKTDFLADNYRRDCYHCK